MDLQTLFAVTYCGLWHPPVAVLPPGQYPVGFGMLQLPWSDLCWLVPIALGTLCTCRICITQLTGPDRCKKLSQCVCIVGLSQEQSSWIL